MAAASSQPSQVEKQIYVVTNKIGNECIELLGARWYQKNAYNEFIAAERENKLTKISDGFGYQYDNEGYVMMVLRDEATRLVKFIKETREHVFMVTEEDVQIVIVPMGKPCNLSSLQINVFLDFIRDKKPDVNEDKCYYTTYPDKRIIPGASRVQSTQIKKTRFSNSSSNYVFTVFFYKKNEYYMMTYTIDGRIPQPARVYKILLGNKIKDYVALLESEMLLNKKAFSIQECHKIKFMPAYFAETGERIVAEDSNIICAICCTYIKNVILNPCKHTDMCSSCVAKIDNKICGICRQPIVSVTPLMQQNIEPLVSPDNIVLDALSIIGDEKNVLQKYIKELEKQINGLQQEFEPAQFPEIIEFGRTILNSNLGLGLGLGPGLGAASSSAN